MLYLGALLIFVAIVLVLSAVGVISKETRGVARSMAAIKALDEAPAELKE